jgi:anti-sigma factor RsiW
VACKNSHGHLLSAYLDGELDLVRSIEMEEHLKTCSECKEELRSHETLRKAIHAGGLYERAPQGLEARIRASLPQVKSAPVIFPVRRAPRQVWAWLATAASIILAAALVWSLVPGLPGHRRPSMIAEEVVSSHIRSLQAGHLIDIESTDQHTVKPWFDGKLDFAPPVRDFSDQGFPLVGGRLDYLNHRNVAALVYGRRKHFINVFIWPVGESAASTVLPRQSVPMQGYNVICWQQAGMNFCAVSDDNAIDLQVLVDLLQQ